MKIKYTGKDAIHVKSIDGEILTLHGGEIVEISELPIHGVEHIKILEKPQEKKKVVKVKKRKKR